MTPCTFGMDAVAVIARAVAHVRGDDGAEEALRDLITAVLAGDNAIDAVMCVALICAGVIDDGVDVDADEFLDELAEAVTETGDVL